MCHMEVDQQALLVQLKKRNHEILLETRAGLTVDVVEDIDHPSRHTSLKAEGTLSTYFFRIHVFQPWR